uniref:Uncharacterized protein n=1 Tax=viral metagenome TaxID=1070528 RepID=A0A6M3IQ93_9ZZZZ
MEEQIEKQVQAVGVIRQEMKAYAGAKADLEQRALDTLRRLETLGYRLVPPLSDEKLREEVAGILCKDCETHQANHRCAPTGDDALDCYGYLADKILNLFQSAQAEDVRQEREIISLRRKSTGEFTIYADGELVETYELDEEHPEMAAGLLPIKLWRTFNKVLRKREQALSTKDKQIEKGE